MVDIGVKRANGAPNRLRWDWPANPDIEFSKDTRNGNRRSRAVTRWRSQSNCRVASNSFYPSSKWRRCDHGIAVDEAFFTKLPYMCSRRAIDSDRDPSPAQWPP